MPLLSVGVWHKQFQQRGIQLSKYQTVSHDWSRTGIAGGPVSFFLLEIFNSLKGGEIACRIAGGACLFFLLEIFNPFKGGEVSPKSVQRG